MSTVAEILVQIVGIYLAVGVVFALWFVLRGVVSVDENVRGTSFWFRLIIIPGSVALWPVLLRKIIMTRRKL